MNPLKHTIVPGFLLAMLLILISLPALGNEQVAIVVKVKGEVMVTQQNARQGKLIRKGQILMGGDRIETGKGTFCAVKFLDDKSLLRIGENSSCIIEGQREGRSIVKNILTEVGNFFFSLFEQPRNFRVNTPTSVASVKGTMFWVLQLSTGETYYICTDGSIEVGNGAGKVLVRKGQTCIVRSRSQAPEVRLTRHGDLPSESGGDAETRELEFEFIDDAGQKKVLRLQLQEQE